MSADSSLLPSAGKPAPVRRRRKKNFPLRVHKGTQYWCKKIRGKVFYFGSLKSDPTGEAALEQYHREQDALEHGRDPDAPDPTKLTVEQLCFAFLEFQEQRVAIGEISPRTFQALRATCKTFTLFFGRTRLVTSLKPDDFGKLRMHLAKTRKLLSLSNEIVRTRIVFRWALKNDLIAHEVKYGSSFDRPKREALDRAREAHKAQHGDKMFEAHELRLMLSTASEPLRTMILLATNCAFGQSDLAALPLRALDLEKGWVKFPRVKTAVPRKIPLWQETVAALQAWLPKRPRAKDPADAELVFLTRGGRRWVRVNGEGLPYDALGHEFRKLLVKLGLKRSGIGLYACRHTFETVAAETLDQVGVDRVMGHKTPGMSSVYTERISDDRLRRIVEHVRHWVFPELSRDGVEVHRERD
jgi:integrase